LIKLRRGREGKTSPTEIRRIEIEITRKRVKVACSIARIAVIRVKKINAIATAVITTVAEELLGKLSSTSELSRRVLKS